MFLHLEGVNPYATIYDTEDLATVRGSSMILENLAKAAQEKLGGDICDCQSSNDLEQAF